MLQIKDKLFWKGAPLLCLPSSLKCTNFDLFRKSCCHFIIIKIQTNDPETAASSIFPTLGFLSSLSSFVPQSPKDRDSTPRLSAAQSEPSQPNL